MTPDSRQRRPVSLHPDDATPAAPVSLKDRNLEEVLLRGLTPQDQEGGRARIHVRSFPLFLSVVLARLNRTQELAITGNRTKLVVKLGAAMLEADPAVMAYREAQQRLLSEYSTFSAMGWAHVGIPFVWHHPAFAYRSYDTQIEVTSDSDEVLGAVSDDLGLPKPYVACMGLVIALTASREWVPEPDQVVCRTELAVFRQALEQAVNIRLAGVYQRDLLPGDWGLPR